MPVSLYPANSVFFPGGGGLVVKLCLTLATPRTVAFKNTEVGCHFLLQEIYLTQELNPGPQHRRQILY